MNGAWYFESLSHSIIAIEPDGTQHVVRFGDMNSAAGIALLNAMTRDLCQAGSLSFEAAKNRAD